ncbi:hypothetical protein KP509_16G014300 [Ceratopteris richardii]|uniref:Uncharacterized protein n=1 Tax=Ceratopteris richardii TaxID=49495 RepID=A0A8T2T154_CERRI|nr:hypothetical protein KP509_16G014300 [Ceratopteris richardii]
MDKQILLDLYVKGLTARLHPVCRLRTLFVSRKDQDSIFLPKNSGTSSLSQSHLVHRIRTCFPTLASRNINSNPTSNNFSEDGVASQVSANANFDNFNCDARDIGNDEMDMRTVTRLSGNTNSVSKSGPEGITIFDNCNKSGNINMNEGYNSRLSDNQPETNDADSARASLASCLGMNGSRDMDSKLCDLSSQSVSEGVTSSAPRLEMHNHVSGKNGSSYANDENEAALSLLLDSKNILEFISRFPRWADAQKESGIPQRQKRAFYSHEDWLRHRSSSRHARHMLSSISSRVIVSLVPPVFTFTSVAIGVAIYNTVLRWGYLPSFLPLLHAASLPYELTAPALALLLVFRTDASYSRYVEARKTWTSVISTTKDLARLSAQLVKNPLDVALKSSLLSYVMAFPIALKCHLIYGSDIKNDLRRLLEEDDLTFVLSSQHRPNCLIQLISQALDHLQLDNSERLLLEELVRQYVASVSICERLLRTPIPLSYTRLTSRFLVLWHISLPIVLWDACDWLVIPATFFSAATLFGIEELYNVQVIMIN